jgi:membrane protein
MNSHGAWFMSKQTVTDFSEDDCMSLAGALAFYTALSLAPLLVILLRVASMLPGDVQQKLVSQIQTVVGPQAGQAIQGIIESAKSQPGWG